LGVQRIHTSAAHPASNGAVERVVKSFKTMLYAHVNAHPQHWVQSLPVIRMQYWSRVHAALGMSPQQMVFGRQLRPAVPLSNDLLLAAAQADSQMPCRLPPVVSVVPDECLSPLEHVSSLQQQLQEQDAVVFQRIRMQFYKNARQWPLCHDTRKGRLCATPLQVGDWVLEVLSGPVPALQDQVKGPFVVLVFCGEDQQIAILSTGGTAFKDPVVFKRHDSNLARYYAKHHLRRVL
jgi:hypothetical protein